MKNFIPTDSDLMRLYYELAQIGGLCSGALKSWRFNLKTKEELLALACEWLRYDPRLLTILVLYFKNHYSEFNPFLLRQELHQNDTPQTMGIITEFIKQLDPQRELKYLLDYLTKGLIQKSNELFFIGLHPPGSTKLKATAIHSLKEYKKWGFLGIERPIVDLETKKTIGSYDAQYRASLLRQLLHQHKKITLSTYLEALNYTVSRQQALYDLKHFLPLKLMGKGRGAYWTLKH